MRERPKFSAHGGPNPHILALVLAGGEGKRLWPLTADRAKPAVPMGGRYRLIDFVLSNLVNSGFYKIKVLTQYMSDSLNAHLARGWRLPAMLDQYVEPVPAQQRRGREWFKGSADAIYQSLNVITDENPDMVMIFGGDHVYKMEVRQMLDYHLETDADCTVAAIPVPVADACAFGIIEVDAGWRILSFEEKPEAPREIPGRPGYALASMGNYIFHTESLIDHLVRDAVGQSQHDFGRNILPDMVAEQKKVYAYDFMRNIIPGMSERERGYWRDVGTITQYYEANMDLVQVVPVFDLYNPRWPLRTMAKSLPPAKFVFHDPSGESGHPRIGFATDSLICEGSIISGGRIDRSVIGPKVRVNSFAYVEESIIHEGVDVGRYCKIRRAIIDKNIRIPPNTEIGLDPEADKQRFHVVDDIVVVPKNHKFEPQ